MRTVLKFSSLDFQVKLFVEKQDDVGDFTLFGLGQIERVVANWIPKVEVHRLAHRLVDPRQHAHHFLLKVLNQPEPVVLVPDLGDENLKHLFELLLVFASVEQLVGLARPKGVLRDEFFDENLVGSEVFLSVILQHVF